MLNVNDNKHPCYPSYPCSKKRADSVPFLPSLPCSKTKNVSGNLALRTEKCIFAVWNI